MYGALLEVAKEVLLRMLCGSLAFNNMGESVANFEAECLVSHEQRILRYTMVKHPPGDIHIIAPCHERKQELVKDDIQI